MTRDSITPGQVPSPETAAGIEDFFGGAVSATLVTALHARANGARMFDVPEWHDAQAVRAWGRLGKLAAERGIDLDALVLRDRMSVVGTIRRSQDIDRRTSEFVTRHPEARIVTLGIGLCNRAARLPFPGTRWLGVDTARVTALRRRVLPEDATRLVTGSVARRDWLAECDPARPTVVIAECLLMYLDRPVVMRLLRDIRGHFRAPLRLIVDLHHSFVALAQSPITRITGAWYRFGTMSPRAFSHLVPGWRLVAVDDPLVRVSPEAALFSRTFAMMTGGPAYAVITLEPE